jgi:hypothetical protein
MLIGRVVDDKFGDHPESKPMRLAKHHAKVIQCAELRVDILIIGDVVAVVLQRRRIKGHQPDGVDAQITNVIELRGEPLEVADAVVVGIEERFDVHLVDDGVFVPKWVLRIELGLRGGIESRGLYVVHLAAFTGSSRNPARFERAAAA